MVSDPGLAREILRAPPGRYLAGAANRRMLPLLPSNTVLTLDGLSHRERRSQLAHLFSGARLSSLAEQISGIVSRELDSWPVGQAFAVLPRLRSLTFNIAARLILGLSDGPKLARLEHDLTSALKPYAILSGHRRLRHLGGASPQAAAARGHVRFARALDEVMEGAELPWEADEIFALLLAGQDTTATALAWALIQLAHLPAVARTLAQQSAAGDHAGRDAVIHETLRLHPPLIDIVRQPAETVSLAGQPIPGGSLLMICPALIGRSPLHTDPWQFQADRFLGRHPDPSGWVPFGGGERRCLGAPLAMLELRAVVTQVLERFQLSPGQPTLEQPRLHGTAVVPSRGGQLNLTLQLAEKRPQRGSYSGAAAITRNRAAGSEGQRFQ